MRFAFALLVLAAPLVAQEPRKPVRRIPVTAEHLRTAFADGGARTLFERARVARLSQDSALRAYDAKSWLRISVGVGVRRIGRQRLLWRSEQSARVRWSRGSNILIEPTGRRVAFSMGRAEVDLSGATPIPYYPGRETLWIPGDAMGVGRVEVNEREFLHPLATGAEAYYKYATGDSASIRLPDGRTIRLRELHVTPRTPDYKAFVGSFWFDVDQGNLVRAAYRMAAEIDIWRAASEEQRRDLEDALEKARADTSAVARAAVDAARREMKDEDTRVARVVLGEMKARITGITVEYGLHGGRFWLPRAHVAEGEGDFGFLRVPVRVEERYRYESVNGSEPPPVVPQIGQAGLTADDTLYAPAGVINIGGGNARVDTSTAAREARADSAVRRYARQVDSLTRRADSLAARGDTAAARGDRQAAAWWRSRLRTIERRRASCATDSTYIAGVLSRFDGAVRSVVRLPCDETELASSPDLPGSIHDPGEEMFDERSRDELLASLDYSLQPEWGPRPPVLHMGLDLVRYNRVEGLSVGATATSDLGLGYTARAEARFGVGDLMPNGALSIARSNGRSELRLGVFHRLAVANDDWGAPLSTGASLANLLYARDEGFYYRAFGAELSGERPAPGPLGGATLAWRLFAERHRSAGVEPNTQLSLGNAIGRMQFLPNIDALSTSAFGAGGDLARSFGADPLATRLDLRLRGEGALTDREDS
ncbi:MAG TPA: hypothetical protein VEA99_14400, partial [Gemmatimonadaceae bacterium]|nr:hypothetical protein [Gemmatimonadaceae bacterium]